MASQYYNVTTNNGDAKIANAIATATKLNITHVVFGDGNGSVPTPDKNRTALVNEVYRVAPSNYYLHPTIANRLIVEAIIPSDVGGFYIREVGLIADTTVLISDGSVAPIFKEASTDGTREYRLKFAINIVDSSIANITLDSSLIYVTQDTIVDNLTTADATKPLSAAQGKDLQDNKLGKLENAASATKLQTARKINGVDFDGTSDIDLFLDVVMYSPIPYPKMTPPTGFLMLMGQAISPDTYPILYSLYGTNLPDMRAKFIRGIDNGRGVDNGRIILSEQGDAIRNITGSFIGGALNFTPTGAFYKKAQDDGSWGGSGSEREDMYYFDASLVVPTANENRPSNIAFNYIVKAG